MFRFKPPENLRSQRNRPEIQKQEFDALCAWIDAHIWEALGWQQLMAQSGLEYQAIQALFFQFENTTAMTWIRRRRGALSKDSLRGQKARLAVPTEVPTEVPMEV